MSVMLEVQPYYKEMKKQPKTNDTVIVHSSFLLLPIGYYNTYLEIHVFEESMSNFIWLNKSCSYIPIFTKPI